MPGLEDCPRRGWPPVRGEALVLTTRWKFLRGNQQMAIGAAVVDAKAARSSST